MILKFDQLQSLVSMVKEMKVMKGKTVSSLFLGCFSSVPFHTNVLAGNNDMHESSKFG